MAIPDTGRPDKIDGLVLVFFAAGRPYSSMNADEVNTINDLIVGDSSCQFLF
ncbi:MAG: hypothetical protein RIG63_23895 [Coleofasciculus chthonoplastes F3-SA18-01]|uniref:hypothetical protein n=1 Tax=Coleofasciculus chthonoplastes TaxID=64178 RepID=UPI0032FFD8E3